MGALYQRYLEEQQEQERRNAAPPSLYDRYLRERGPVEQPPEPEQPGVLSRTLSALGHAVTHPVETAKTIVTAPFDALKVAGEKIGQTAAELTLPIELQNIAYQDPDRVSDEDAALAGLQLATLGLGAGASKALAGGLEVALPARAAQAIAGSAVTAAGAAFMPNDPAVGALVGTALHGAAAGAGRLVDAARTRLRVPETRESRLLPAQSDPTLYDEPARPGTGIPQPPVGWRDADADLRARVERKALPPAGGTNREKIVLPAPDPETVQRIADAEAREREAAELEKISAAPDEVAAYRNARDIGATDFLFGGNIEGRATTPDGFLVPQLGDKVEAPIVARPGAEPHMVQGTVVPVGQQKVGVKLEGTARIRPIDALPWRVAGDPLAETGGFPAPPRPAEPLSPSQGAQGAPAPTGAPSAAAAAAEHASARTPSGALRSNLTRVSTDALVSEIMKLGDANAVENTAPTVVGQEGSGIGSYDPWVGMKGGAMKALGRVRIRQQAIDRLGAELARRGVDFGDAAARLLGSGEGRDEFSVGMGRGKRALPESATSLFPSDQTNLLGEPATVAETDLGKRAAAPPATAPARSPLAGIPDEHLPGQSDLFSVGSERGKRPLRPMPTGEPADLPSPKEMAHAMREAFAPGSIEGAGERMAQIVRATRGEHIDRAGAIARQQLGALAAHIDQAPVAAQLDFIHRIETGASQANAAWQPLADGMRKLLDERRDQIRALGKGKLERFIEDYFPHIWKDPEQSVGIVKRILGKKPLGGPQSFLKERTIPTTRDGIKAGLVPVTTNPIDLTLLKLREMDRYLFKEHLLTKLKAGGLAKLEFGKIPDGWARVNDDAFTQYGPNEVKVWEGYDKIVRDKLGDLIKSLPALTHRRTPKLPQAGLAYGPAGHLMETKFGGESGVIMHELGHILDFRYKLWDRLIEPPKGQKQTAAQVRARVTIQNELRALADQRWQPVVEKSGGDVSTHFKSYVREREEKIANLMHAFLYAPELLDEVAPTAKAKLTGLLREHKELHPLFEIKPSLVLGGSTATVPVFGRVIQGYYVVPADAARILNNYLAPGLRGNPIYDAWMAVGNTLNQAQLGAGAFHAGFTTLDQAVSRTGLGIGALVRGKPLTGMRDIASTPVAPFTQFGKGRKLIREYNSPGSVGGDYTDIADMVARAGGRFQYEYAGDAARRFRGAVRERNFGRAAVHFLPATIETLTAPIMEHLVPIQKAAVFMDLARREVDALGPAADEAARTAAMQRAWDSVDNRLGQVVYDNIFWKKAFKDGLHASVRSVGWNYGSFRELGGGAADLVSLLKKAASGTAEAKDVTPRLQYLIALPITVGVVSAVINYLYTGEAPKDQRDLFHPRDGTFDADGNPNRLSLPSYMKDVFALTSHPVQTLKNKAHPLASAMFEMLNNRDFYGDEIRNADAPLVQQFRELAEYAAHSLTPFSVRGLEEAKKGGASFAQQALPFIGITPANRADERTDAQNKMTDYLARRGHPTRTPEEVEQQRELSGLKQQSRAQGPQAVSARVGELLGQRAISPAQARNVYRASVTNPLVERFKMLSVDEAERVFALATAKEKALWLPWLQRKEAQAGRALQR